MLVQSPPNWKRISPSEGLSTRACLNSTIASSKRRERVKAVPRFMWSCALSIVLPFRIQIGRGWGFLIDAVLDVQAAEKPAGWSQKGLRQPQNQVSPCDQGRRELFINFLLLMPGQVD